MILYRFLSSVYLKYFFVILVGLELFYVGIDYMSNAHDLPESANIKILYATYVALYALNYTLPISIILAQITVILSLVRKNEFTALNAIGYSKQKISATIFTISLIITAAFIGLNATPFAYAKEKLDNILNSGSVATSKENFFVKYQNFYIYFEKLYPLSKQAEVVRVYEVKDGYLTRIIKSQSAEYSNGFWIMKNPTIITKPKNPKLGEEGLEIIHVERLEILKGFKPKILDNIYETKGILSIADAIESIKLLQVEGINSGKIRSILYSLLFFPLFAPLFGLIIFKFAPVHMRYENMSLLAFKGIILALGTWGLFFALSKLAISGLINPEISILLPTILIVSLSIYTYKKS